MIGQTLGHYRIVSKLGAGGMGEVYRARDEKLERDVALKVLPAASFADPAARARLLREAQSAAGLNHPHICTVYEAGEAAGQVYIAMELAEGQPLSARLESGPLPPAEMLRIALQLAGALAHAHDRGIVHRDLKSANVVLTADGRAKVLDFGLARRMAGEGLEEATRSQLSLSQPGTVTGTLAYMAPEQLRGERADARSDLWALGVVLYEMAAGARPFQGHTGFQLSAAIMSQTPRPLPATVPLALRAVIERCLEKEPARRYQRAGEVRAALEAAQAAAETPQILQQGQPSRRSRRLLWAVLGAALAGGIIALLLDAGGLRSRLSGGAGAARIDSLAVLPLKNLMGDPEQDYFVEGMHEALTAELSKVSALKVISRTSTMRYKESDKPMPQIARELGVNGLIEGSVLREGNQVRITVQLIHGPRDQHLWAESYQRELRGVLALQSEVAKAIASQIRASVTPAEESRLARSRSVNPEAYQAYLRGRFYWNRRDDEGLMKSLDYFAQAIAADPGYALAYAGLADAYGIAALLAILPSQEALPKARAAAVKALEIDPGLAEAHTSLGMVAHSEWDWAAAEKEYRLAMELNPNYATTYQFASVLLSKLERYDQAIAYAERARELDPLSLIIGTSLANAYGFAGQHERSEQEMKKVLDMNPNFAHGHDRLGRRYWAGGAYGKAIVEFEAAVALAPDTPDWLGDLGAAYGAVGKKKEAEQMLARLQKLSRQRYVRPEAVAVVYAGLGENDKAFEWLEKAYQERACQLPFIKLNPLFDKLRSDPRYGGLMRRFSLPH